MKLLTAITFILLLVSHIFVFLTIQKKTTAKLFSFLVLYLVLASPLVYILVVARQNGFVDVDISLGIGFLLTWAAIIVMCAIGFFRVVKKYVKPDEI
ncbi:hypothetical protein NDK47_22995 [Brevibacillus ruminantium]|uniref:Uncharacterized protein n=1 Tax=Brevibacillus ruminantium TaxID=2950604 RepID=A0ABY4WGJ3_9BACL|nr:hypothetical protein [Brevibacillus ruminantium]USG64960.1 hypothetical protein NDK47_22995 [Brevibacillus ruminantium]